MECRRRGRRTCDDDDDFNSLAEEYGEILGNLQRIWGHIGQSIGSIGIYETIHIGSVIIKRLRIPKLDAPMHPMMQSLFTFICISGCMCQSL